MVALGLWFLTAYNFKFQSLEKRLAEILRLSYNHCPTVESQLRLLEVFEGVSGRELVQVSGVSFSPNHLMLWFHQYSLTSDFRGFSSWVDPWN